MKKTNIITLMLLVTGLGFGTENLDNFADAYNRRRPVQREPTTALEIQLNRKDQEKSTGEKIASGVDKTLEKAPQVIDTVSQVLEKAPQVVEKIGQTMEKFSPKQSHFYLRMNVMEPNAKKRQPLIPGMSVGFRRAVSNAAFDISAEYYKSTAVGKKELIVLPKLAYFYFLSPSKSPGIYVGPSIAYGRIKSSPGNRFEGLIPGASIGLETSRGANVLTFFQVDVNLPIIPAKATGPLPGVMAEFAFGAGF